MGQLIFNILQKGIEKSKLENSDKLRSVEKLHRIIANAEKNFTPSFDLNEVIEEERSNSWKYGGKTVFGDAKKPAGQGGIQLSLF